MAITSCRLKTYSVSPTGKREKRNEIVNSVVPKSTKYGGEIEINQGMIKNCVVLKKGFDRNRTETGLNETEMEHKYGLDLFRKGLARGHFWQERDGMYYSKTVTRNKNDGFEESQKLDSSAEAVLHLLRFIRLRGLTMAHES